MPTPPMITFYDHPGSGNCYKVRLFLSLIDVPCRREFIDVLARKNQTEAFERISAWRQVPAIVDDGLAIWDSHAILLYLAQKHAAHWLAPLPRSGQMYAWISMSTNEIANSLQRRTDRVLTLMEKRLAENDWLAIAPSVADIDCYG